MLKRVVFKEVVLEYHTALMEFQTALMEHEAVLMEYQNALREYNNFTGRLGDSSLYRSKEVT